MIAAAREITGTPDGGNGDVRRLWPPWRLKASGENGCGQQRRRL